MFNAFSKALEVLLGALSVTSEELLLLGCLEVVDERKPKRGVFGPGELVVDPVVDALDGSSVPGAELFQDPVRDGLNVLDVV